MNISFCMWTNSDVTYKIDWKKILFPEIFSLWRDTKRLWLEDIIKSKKNSSFSFKSLNTEIKILVEYNPNYRDLYTVKQLVRFEIIDLSKLKTKTEVLVFLKKYLLGKNFWKNTSFTMTDEDFLLENKFDVPSTSVVEKKGNNENWHVKEYFDSKFITFTKEVSKLSRDELQSKKDEILKTLTSFPSISSFNTWIVSPLNHMLANRGVFSWAAFADLEIEQNRQEKNYLKKQLQFINQKLVEN